MDMSRSYAKRVRQIVDSELHIPFRLHLSNSLARLFEPEKTDRHETAVAGTTAMARHKQREQSREVRQKVTII